MRNNNKRICQQSSVEDRISNLPPELLLRILDRLPLRDAARTSVLSRHWNHKWASRSELILDLKFFTDFLKGRSETHDICLDYMLTINDILLTHVGPLSRFQLYIPRLFPKQNAITQWIRYVSSKGIKDIFIRNAQAQKTSLPTCLLYSCLAGLTKLILVNCKLPSLPSTFDGFPYLVRLALIHCAASAYSSNTLGILISKCPRLKILHIDHIEHFQSDLTIRTPNLQKLSLMGQVLNLCLKETSAIQGCHLNVECVMWHRSWYLTECFNCLPNVVLLKLLHPFWKVTHHYDFIPPKKFLKQLQQLKQLHLVGVPLNRSTTMSFIVQWLFETSPNLETLYLKAADVDNANNNNVAADEVGVDGWCNLKCLRTVQLVNITGLKNELLLIKCILASSPELRVMSIEFGTRMVGAEQKYRFTRELMRYCRASSHTQIVFKDN